MDSEMNPPPHLPPPPPGQEVPYAPPPHRKGMSGWVIALLIALPILGVVMCGAGAYLFLQGFDVPVNAQDRELLVTVGDLAPYFPDLNPDLSVEKFTKTRYLDRSYDLEYEYEHPDEATPLYLYCAVTVELSESDARMSYQGYRIGTNIGFSLEEGVTLKDRDDLFRWGDASMCRQIRSGGSLVGNFFLTRKGRRVFCFSITGVYFDDTETLRELLLPHLERLSSYKP